MDNIILQHTGQVKYTDPNGKVLLITAEHTKEGGWKLLLNFGEGNITELETIITLPPRDKKETVMDLKTSAYDWNKRD